MNATVTAAAPLIQSTLPGYKAFNITILIVCVISAILCVIMIVAMTLPLLHRRRRKKYSTYNLYIAYLAVPELITNIFVMHVVLTYTIWTSQTSTETETETNLWLFDHSFDYIVFTVCQTANLYTNAFLTFEIFQLLKKSSIRKRHTPPTIARVTKQNTIAYGVGIVLSIAMFLIIRHRPYSPLGNEDPIMDYLLLGFALIFLSIIPLSILIVFSAMIYCQGLVRSTNNGRFRVLFFFYLRIILTDILIWLPATVFYAVSWVLPDGKTQVLTYNAYLLISGCKAIVNFGCCLTKPDTRELIVNLLKCVYCRQWNEAGGESERRSEIRFGDPNRKSSMISTSTRPVSFQPSSNSVGLEADETLRLSITTGALTKDTDIDV